MNNLFATTTFSGIKAFDAEFKGDKICSYCRTKMNRRLKDLNPNFDWTHGRREKFQVSNYEVCNQCLYHIALLGIVGLNEEVIPDFLTLAYQASMNLEEVYFNPISLSCETISFIDDFSTLERRDEQQSMYCLAFNNAYDACKTGAYKRWFNKNNWHSVLGYTRGRFYQIHVLGNRS